MAQIKPGSVMIAEERSKQLSKGHTLDQDQKYYGRDVFSKAAVALLECNSQKWPAEMGGTEYCRELIKEHTTEQRIAIAGALIAAEIDFINYHQFIQNLHNTFDIHTLSTSNVIAEIDQYIQSFEAQMNPVSM